MYNRIRYGGDGLQYNFSEFLCDSVSDLASLPTNLGGTNGKCSFGSKAFVLESNTTYVLNNNNEWVVLQISSNTSSGSSGSVDSSNIATVSEVMDYLNI